MSNGSNIENNIKRIQELINNLEDSNIDVEQAVKCFEEGMKLTKTVEEQIKTIKGRITKIVDNVATEFKVEE